MMRKREKGSVLILSFITFTILFTAGQALFSRTISEIKLAEIALTKHQAFYLADGGKNVSLSELRERINGNLNQQVRSITDIDVLRGYLSRGGALNFLRDYAYANGRDVRFTRDTVGNDPRASLPIDLPDAGTGGYSALLEIFANGEPVENPPAFFTFPYRYQISSTGTANRNGLQQFVQVSGAFTVTVQRDNFARYALFTNTHAMPGGTIVWFTGSTNFQGPVHTNTRLSLALNPSGTFTDSVSQVQQTARYYNNREYRYLDADRNEDRDVPTFQAGFARGVTTIPLPATTDMQTHQRIALGLQSSETMPVLGDGVYLPATEGVLKGGIYIQGDAEVTLELERARHQRYVIDQGSTTQEITVYPDQNTTVVTDGRRSTTYQGVPNGLFYVNGTVDGLSGTVSNETQLTIAGTEDVLIDHHLQYQNFSTTPTLNANGERNLLGLVSWEGNVRITRNAPDSLKVHGVVMAPRGIFTVDLYNRGRARGVVALLGGAITNEYGAFGTFSSSGPVSGYGRNFVYDERMRNGASPPFFPTVNAWTSDSPDVNALPAWSPSKREEEESTGPTTTIP